MMWMAANWEWGSLLVEKDGTQSISLISPCQPICDFFPQIWKVILDDVNIYDYTFSRPAKACNNAI